MPTSIHSSDWTEKGFAPAEALEATDGSLPRKNAGGDIFRVYSWLRQHIITGEIEQGSILNQVHIARDLSVSRTPVREALRMLQTENLVETNHQHRVRVTSITPGEVESVYATWIVVQALGTALTVPRSTQAEIEAIKQSLHHLGEQEPAEPSARMEWDGAHETFHRLLVKHAGPMIQETIKTCWSRSERARRNYIRTSSYSYDASYEEHAGLAEAYETGDTALAIQLSSRQLARTALQVIAMIDLAYEPAAVRRALAMATAPTVIAGVR